MLGRGRDLLAVPIPVVIPGLVAARLRRGLARIAPFPAATARCGWQRRIQPRVAAIVDIEDDKLVGVDCWQPLMLNRHQLALGLTRHLLCQKFLAEYQFYCWSVFAFFIASAAHGCLKNIGGSLSVIPSRLRTFTTNYRLKRLFVNISPILFWRKFQH
jgi:hypothetical protein